MKLSFILSILRENTISQLFSFTTISVLLLLNTVQFAQSVVPRREKKSILSGHGNISVGLSDT